MGIGDELQLSVQDLLLMLGDARAQLELAGRKLSLKDARIQALEAEVETLKKGNDVAQTDVPQAE